MPQLFIYYTLIIKYFLIIETHDDINIKIDILDFYKLDSLDRTCHYANYSRSSTKR